MTVLSHARRDLAALSVASSGAATTGCYDSLLTNLSVELQLGWIRPQPPLPAAARNEISPPGSECFLPSLRIEIPFQVYQVGGLQLERVDPRNLPPTKLH